MRKLILILPLLLLIGCGGKQPKSIKKGLALVMHYQKPIIERGYSKRPFPTISWQTQKYVDQFVKFNPFYISKLPPAIKKPELPPVENLVRGKFEKTIDFKIRVKEAMDKRDRELLAIQEKYRDEVESRNRILDNFQKVNSKVTLLKDISIEKFQNRATKWALDDVIPILNISYEIITRWKI